MEVTQTELNEARVYLDGDKWCALVGRDLQSGIAGFGDTKAEALERLATALLINSSVSQVAEMSNYERYEWCPTCSKYKKVSRDVTYKEGSFMPTRVITCCGKCGGFLAEWPVQACIIPEK